VTDVHAVSVAGMLLVSRSKVMGRSRDVSLRRMMVM